MGRRFAFLLSAAWLLIACQGRPEPAPQARSLPASQAPTAIMTLQIPTPVSDLATPDPFAADRAAMVARGVEAMGVTAETVLAAMNAVPRHAFVPPELVQEAYANYPLPIGYGQTISQPYIVALMTEAAAVEAGDRVLEIGTGSGYQAAVLAEIGAQVYTIEIIKPLADRAAATLAGQGYANVTTKIADGYNGWEDQAPFDAILVTAAPDHVPKPLIEQLKPGAHLIIPVGPIGGIQTLWRITRSEDGEIRSENLGAVRFVPLTRGP